MQSGYNINDLFQEAQARWLKPAEVLFILQNHDKYKFATVPAQQPSSGSLFLFNKRILRFFRRDGHRWRKKKDGRTVGEAHERLKVGNVETLNCYYAHGEDNPSFQRRSYWMLDPAYEHIVLVHYRETNEGKPSTGSFVQSPVSSSFSHSPSSNTTRPGSISIVSDLHEPYQNLSSPGSLEVSSDIVIKENGRENPENLYGTGELDSLTKLDVNQALRQLEEQLSLDEDSFKGFVDDNPNALDILDYGDIANQDQFNAFNGPEYVVHDQFYNEPAQMQGNADYSGEHQIDDREIRNGNKESATWKEFLDPHKTSSVLKSEEKSLYTLDRNENPLSSLSGPTEVQEHCQWLNSNGNIVDNYSLLLPQEVDSFKLSPYSSVTGTHSDYYTQLFEQGQIGSLESDISLTVAQNQKFTVQEISPEWGYATEATKVIIIGSFLCDPSESAWTCMFGDIEVPAQIIQEGVIRCEAPPHLPGKVTVCITAGNRVSCSEVREFEYRVKSTSYTHNNSPPQEAAKSAEELLLLVRFVQMLTYDSSVQKRDSAGSESLRKLKADDDSWGTIIESLLLGNGSSSTTIYWLLEELLKDKLQQWLSSRSHEFDQYGCCLSKKEQGIIHMVAGLGFEWALNPILNCGVNINFRDINGWTALHWAARFGREKMVALLVASGASAGAVTDPSSQDPVGRTAASIAAINGHKGLAGYLSELSLTSHLSSLTLEETELSKGSAEVEAEITVNSISNRSLEGSEDQESLKNTLAAVRNAAQAAARIQSAFRAHSFRKRQLKEAGISIDDYGISSDDIPGLSAFSKQSFRNPRDYNSAAVSIQKKYRGYKGRKDFLVLRQKVVKIQAHVRGYQVRKHYKVICWAVGILDKVVLRWRRKGAGLRGFRQETQTDEESEDEDILKVFRKQKVNVAIEEAVSRVLSMVESPKARQQYHRMLTRYHQAKAELGGTSGEGFGAEADTPHSGEDDLSVDDIDMYLFP
ncbi:calmodulin-binding transcription activator 4-like [Pyrus ussuriensis x Pyrus communis]|uniref:Calmodulin-binding transcription activator 4-like n=1 Tax=Pyrus ussuriensis x Pyrus communis TaxID=2448454 RepID=A0A5N5FAY8_9ROSA|nr:calmodulin-binding transcription activator 4-like [Pyrus ussuriensis x Pyrus communis]